MPTADHAALLATIDAAAPHMEARLLDWANINSGSSNSTGLHQMADRLAAACRELGARVELVPLLGGAAPSVRARKHSDAPVQVLACGHFDTVYEANHPFQWCTQLADDTIGGPGVADMKGGLVVMLEALRALEASPHAGRLGWEALIVPDEETGSATSLPLLREAADRNHLGIVFEPALASGAVVGSRKGVGTVRVTARGRAAHAGRDFASGRSAIVAIARMISAAHGLNATIPDVVVNAGSVSGGGTVNIVPDHAVAEFNVRATREADGEELMRRLLDVADAIGRALEVPLELEGGFTRPPMEASPAALALFEAWCAGAHELGVEVKVGHSGGGSDGNTLVAAGLPCIDGAGVEGGELHSDREWMRLSSLPRRAKIAALFLLRLAAGEIVCPKR
jgi:glutamate carboxypeptidase